MLTDCHGRANQSFALWEQRISSKAWALSVVPRFSVSPPRVAFSRVGWFSRAFAFRSLYYPWGKTGTTRSLPSACLTWLCINKIIPATTHPLLKHSATLLPTRKAWLGSTSKPAKLDPLLDWFRLCLSTSSALVSNVALPVVLKWTTKSIITLPFLWRNLKEKIQSQGRFPHLNSNSWLIQTTPDFSWVWPDLLSHEALRSSK